MNDPTNPISSQEQTSANNPTPTPTPPQPSLEPEASPSRKVDKSQNERLDAVEADIAEIKRRVGIR
jgi:hypothetical protein